MKDKQEANEEKKAAEWRLHGVRVGRSVRECPGKLTGACKDKVASFSAMHIAPSQKSELS